MQLNPQEKGKLESALANKGLRSTRQREQVFAVVLASRDHPSADLVYQRVKASMPTISLATVYNCLDTLAECDLIRQIHFERAPSRYCFAKEQLKHHAHFHCQETGRVFDFDLPDGFIEDLSRMLPEGFRIEKIDLTVSGACSSCHEEQVRMNSTSSRNKASFVQAI